MGRRPFQLRDEHLTPEQRDHLNGVVFPTVMRLVRTAQARIEARKRDQREGV